MFARREIEKKRVFLKGVLRAEARIFSQYSGEVVYRGDVIYGNTTLNDIPILRLTIEMDVYDEGTDVWVDDEYCHLIPYLKPVKEFRHLLELELPLLFANESAVIKAGAEKYLEESRDFSELKSLVRQAKSCVNALKPERKGAERIARSILLAMDKTPQIDVIFQKEVHFG